METQKGSNFKPFQAPGSSSRPAISSTQRTGISYNNIVWKDIAGNPFGAASAFNVITFDDANNIVDSEGGMAIGGNFVSSRGLSIGLAQQGIENRHLAYSPDLVRFLVGGDVQISGVTTVVGHVVGAGRYDVLTGSTYFIGKDGTSTQKDTLAQLYAAEGGSPYWLPAERDTHYLIPVYDVSRYIPASRINANVPKFFSNAYKSITAQAKKINEGLAANGTVTETNTERILKGTDPKQNVFVIDVSKDGVLERQLRFDTPASSINIVKVLTGDVAYWRFGRWGTQEDADRTLFTFPQATRIRMEEPGALWGSLLAPDATLDVHTTGGNVNGNAAVRSFFVAPGSGFEFHWHPLSKSVSMSATGTLPEITPPIGTLPPAIKPPIGTLPPTIKPPICTLPPTIKPPVQPLPKPPGIQPLPKPPIVVQPLPKPPVEIAPPIGTIPTQRPIVVEPILPIPIPVCPEQECDECDECYECDECECRVREDVILGTINACLCERKPCRCMCWEICVCYIADCKVCELECIQVKLGDGFKFKAPYEGEYVLRVKPLNAHSRQYKPRVVLHNVGVMQLSIEYLY